jgi:hypothetical protein
VVGYCASSRIDEAVALAPHDWATITGNGFGSRHDATGDWLYGIEMAVDERRRGLRIGKRLYEARRGAGGAARTARHRVRRPHAGLCPRQGKGGHARGVSGRGARGHAARSGGRVPARQWLHPDGVLRKYLPFDKPSAGFAAHMVWRNPYVDPTEPPAFRVPRDVESVRLATVQLQARAVKDFAEFVKQVEYFVDVAADYRSDFVVFPECSRCRCCRSRRPRCRRWRRSTG